MFKPLSLCLFLSLAWIYDGMDSYAKLWLSILSHHHRCIIASRYFARILRLTYSRSLSVLATLFLLSYTGDLGTVLTVLFSYSTITHLPSENNLVYWCQCSIVWVKIDHTIHHMSCVILTTNSLQHYFVIYKTLLQFRLINYFKPLLDAFHGSYKNRYYYWVAVHIIMSFSFLPVSHFKFNSVDYDHIIFGM